MNLSFLRYFVAVAETGSFTAAAERCRVTQPTLSAGIAKLEQAIGARLIERGRRSGLSTAGRRLLPHARSMLEAWQTARAEQRTGQRPRLLRIALAATLPSDATLQWLGAVLKSADFEVEIADGPADATADRWRRGRCDIALFPVRTPATPEVDATRAVALWREPYLLAAAADHRVATRDRWSARDLADTPFVLRAACEAHDEAQRLFAAAGVRPRAVLRSVDEQRCAAAVLAGLGVGLMPRSLLRPGMASAEIREVALERRVVLAWRAGTDPALVELLQESARAHAWPGLAPGRDSRLDFAR
ncbi:MAG: LysR family transcriptional regulator [Pseudomonadota bacterium]